MSETENCCCCIPIDCGVKAIAAFIIIKAAATLLGCFTEEGGWSFYWSLLAVQFVMVVLLIPALTVPSKSTKNLFFWAQILVNLICAGIIYSYLVFSGKFADRVCS